MLIRQKIRESLLNSWHRPSLLTALLLPFSFVYGFLFWLRKNAYAFGLLKSYQAPVPVIVVGNITVGGTGKTPLVISLVELLRKEGYSPGVISRGYSGQSESYPLIVKSHTPVEQSGDEPALIVRHTDAPMVVGADRAASIKKMLEEFKVDIIVSDDGLQHLALNRDVEICLVDDTQITTKQFLLPAGPYRELPTRLSDVDLVVRHQMNNEKISNKKSTEFLMHLKAEQPVSLSSNTLAWKTNKMVHAVAGIGNPSRFFSTCRTMGFDIIEHAFNDHHLFCETDICFDDSLAVLMTEKDAVKCSEFANDKHWYLPVKAQLSDGFVQRILTVLESKRISKNKSRNKLC